MTTELKRGGIVTKIKINGYLKDITNNEVKYIDTKAIKNKEKISYYLDDEKYILKIISSTRVMLNRNTSELDSVIYFEKNKIIPALFIIKENKMSLEINIRTDKIEINDKYIKISYTVIESNNNFEYYIEMSE